MAHFTFEGRKPVHIHRTTAALIGAVQDNFIKHIILLQILKLRHLLDLVRAYAETARIRLPLLSISAICASFKANSAKSALLCFTPMHYCHVPINWRLAIQAEFHFSITGLA